MTRGRLFSPGLSGNVFSLAANDAVTTDFTKHNQQA